MTQLVGRILRQPYAQKSKVEALDQCYVFCHHATTKEVVEGIKECLEKDGMADLVQEIHESDDTGSGKTTTRKIQRRKGFENLQIFLPVVNYVANGTVRPLDYENDVLMNIEWGKIDIQKLADFIPKDVSSVKSQMTQINVSDGSDGEFFPTSPSKILEEDSPFDPVYATRIISDIIPNPWVARAVVARFVNALSDRGFKKNKIGQLSNFILEELRKYLTAERDKMAEARFMADVANQSIQFRLRTDTHNWKMPDYMWTELPANSPKLTRDSGDIVEKSLFAPAYELDFNGDEQGFACYLDEHKALVWWHRNVAKAGQYFLQGWRKHRVYPDFIFAKSNNHIVVIETKGDQLEGNLDTTYKQKLLNIASNNFAIEQVTKAGKLELVVDDKTTVVCDLWLMSQWKVKVSSYLNN